MKDNERKRSVVEEAYHILNNGHHHQAIRSLECEFSSGTLTIKGRLPNYYSKQVAQTLLMNIEGVERLNNEAEVIDGESRLPSVTEDS